MHAHFLPAATAAGIPPRMGMPTCSMKEILVASVPPCMPSMHHLRLSAPAVYLSQTSQRVS